MLLIQCKRECGILMFLTILVQKKEFVKEILVEWNMPHRYFWFGYFPPVWDWLPVLTKIILIVSYRYSVSDSYTFLEVIMNKNILRKTILFVVMALIAKPVYPAWGMDTLSQWSKGAVSGLFNQVKENIRG